jgi:hypothetical protein
MTVKREDLMAAAAAGLLPASQVDTMLIFLRQRDIVQQREQRQAAGAQQVHAGVRGSQALLYLLAVLALGCAVVAVMLQAGLALDPGYIVRSDPDAGRLCTYVVLGVLLTIGLADRVERRKPGAAARILSMSWLGLVLIAALALHQAGLLRLPLPA